MNVVSVVEGHGDVAAVPIILGKIGSTYGIPIFPQRCIRTGGWSHLQRAGELERYLELALSHEPELVLIISDLDDHCPVQQAVNFRARINLALGTRNIRVEVVFAVREFECWFLHSAEILSNKVGNIQWDLSSLPAMPKKYSWRKRSTRSDYENPL